MTQTSLSYCIKNFQIELPNKRKYWKFHRLANTFTCVSSLLIPIQENLPDLLTIYIYMGGLTEIGSAVA